MRQRIVIRYSIGFKQQVIQQFESGLDSGDSGGEETPDTWIEG